MTNTIFKNNTKIGNPYDFLDRNRHRKMVFYGRVSTEHEAQMAALENQIEWYDDQAKYHPNWEVLNKYIDEGITGTQAKKRPAFLQMIEDAKKGKFDLIVTREVCRFARNTVDTLVTTRELKNIGVEVYFVEDNIWTMDGDGELRLTIMATLAQEESRKTSERVKAGQHISRQQGMVYGRGNILGYNRKAKSTYTINPEQAETVRMIFDLYLQGEMGASKIANELTRLGRKNASGLVKWSPCVITRIVNNPTYMGYQAYGKSYSNNYLEQKRILNNDFSTYMQIKDELERRGRKTSAGLDRWYCTVISHILKNSFYCGIITYHKEYTPDYLTQKKVKNYGEIEFTKVQGSHEALVSVADYERVQIIMESKRSKCKNLDTGRKTTGKRPRTTVWGKLLVFECGHKFSMRVWDRKDRVANAAYQCYSSVHTGSYKSRKKRGLSLDGICQTPMIPEWRLQMMANYIFRNYLTEKDKVLALANSMLEAHIGDTESQEDHTEILRCKRAELEKLNTKLDNFIEMRAEDEISKDLFKKKTSELELTMQKLDSEIKELESKQKPEIQIEDYAEKLTVLQYALEQYTNWDDKDIPESVIEAFVVKIVASKDGFDWYLRFNGNPDDPLHCTVGGKRKSTATISVAGECSPAVHKGNTGRN